MARFISLTLATLLSMAVFAQAAPTGSASTTDINGQVPQQEGPNGGTDIAAPSGPNKRSNGQDPQQEGQNGHTSIAAPNGANKRSNDISTNQPATAGTTTGKQKTKETEKRSTNSSNGPGVDENTNVPEKRSSENDLPEDVENQVKEQEEKRSASAHQSESGNASGGKKSIGKRCNKDVTGAAADQGQQPPVSVGGQEGAATTPAGDQQDGALDGMTKRSDNEIKDKTQHQARDNEGAAFEGTAGHGQQGEKVEKRHNKGKNNGKNKQNNKGGQPQGAQPGQPGQPGQAAASPQ